MTDLTIQKMTADEYHDLVDCIQQGCRIELDEYLEDHSPDNLTTLGQVLLEFFQFHQERMKEHSQMLRALRSIDRFCSIIPEDVAWLHGAEKQDFVFASRRVREALRLMPPILIGQRVEHVHERAKGTLVGIEFAKPVVRWDHNAGSGTPVTGRVSSWGLIREVPER